MMLGAMHAAAAPPRVGPSGLPGGPAHVQKLPNGLELVVKEDHAKPLVSVYAYVDGGARTEDPARAGLAHYYEHIIFRGGTRKQKELETRKRFQVLGDFDGFTNFDHTVYGFTVPREHFDEAMRRFFDALFDVQITADKVEKDRQSIVQELHMRVSDDPGGLCNFNLWNTAFGKHPYRFAVIGDRKVVETAKLPLFQTFYAERYVPNLVTIAVVGDVDAGEAAAQVLTHAGPRKSGRASFELGMAEPPQTAMRTVEPPPKDVALTTVAMGFKIPPGDDPIHPTLDVIGTLLGGLKDARLETRLHVGKKPLVAYVYASPATLRDESLFQVTFASEPGDAEAALGGAFDELARLTRDPVAPAELARARNKIVESFIAGNETYRAQANVLGLHASQGRLPLLARYVDEVERVDAEMVRAAARRIFVRERLTVSSLRRDGATKLDPVAAAAKAGLPSAEESRLVSAPRGKPDSRTLGSGLTLVTVVDRSVPRVTVSLAARGGLLAEDAKQAGAHHLLSQSLERGTAKLDAGAFRKRLDDLAAEAGPVAATDYGGFYVSGPARSGKDLVDLCVDAGFRPRLGPAEVEKVRTDALAAIAAVEDDSFALTDREFMRRLYGDGPLGRHLYGDKDSVLRLKPADLRALHARVWVPRNAVLVVAGDIDPAAVGKWVDAATRGLPRTAPPKLADAAPRGNGAGGDQNVRKAVKQITFDMGSIGIGWDHPDWLALEAARYVLRYRLFYRYVYDEGLAYRMWTLLPRWNGSSPLYYQMGVAPENFDRARKGILAAAEAFARSGMSPAELEETKAGLVQQHELRQQTLGGLAGMMVEGLMRGRPASWVMTYSDDVRNLRLDVVNAAARQYLRPKDLATVWVGER